MYKSHYEKLAKLLLVHTYIIDAIFAAATTTHFTRMTTKVVMNMGMLITNDDYNSYRHRDAVSALYPKAM